MKLLSIISVTVVIAALIISSSPAIPAAEGPASEQQLLDAEQIYRRDGPEAALPLFEELSTEYEISGEKKPLNRIDDNTYQIIDPNNGRESIYIYEDGILQSSSIEHRMATIYTELLPD